MNVYDVGDLVRISGTFTNASNVDADPTTITLKVQAAASGVTTTYTYAASQVVRDGVGLYHYDFSPTVSGTHVYEWEVTGTVQAAEAGAFYVRPAL